jgi:prepilin-type N-terminal cleavage/methylation domain-containing protein
MPKSYGGRPRAPAFTLLEVLIVIFLLGILAVLGISNYPALIAKVQEARCMGNMRAIHLGLTYYLNDHEAVWPQGPPPDEEGAWSRFWIDTLARYDVTEGTWQCPTLRSMIATSGVPERERPRLHYVPTMFSDTKGIAYRWPTQPWLIERGDAHGRGALICFPDGAIKPFSKVLAEQGIR